MCDHACECAPVRPGLCDPHSVFRGALGAAVGFPRGVSAEPKSGAVWRLAAFFISR
jgi:hypothetical protein